MNWAGYFATITASMIKFVAGPLVGETTICTVIGMMLTVVILMFFGVFIGKFFKSNKPKKKFTKTNRLAVKVRSKFGLIGVAGLTPLLFTPSHMLVSAGIWAVVQTLFFYFVKDLIIK
ncbi:MAG: hypothetical protein MUF45_11305 [Spirosomaceae bacterium]|nr:hypothetical protein [Spirosomataceae bacterium]